MVPPEGALVIGFQAEHPIGSVCPTGNACPLCRAAVGGDLELLDAHGDPAPATALLILAPATEAEWRACVRATGMSGNARLPPGPVWFYFVSTD